MKPLPLLILATACGSAAPPETSFGAHFDGGAEGGAPGAGGSTVIVGSGGAAQSSSGGAHDSGSHSAAGGAPFDGGPQPGELCTGDPDCPEGFACVQTSTACAGSQETGCWGKLELRCIRTCVSDPDCPSDGCCAFYQKPIHAQALTSCPGNTFRACGDPTFCKFVPLLPPC